MNDPTKLASPRGWGVSSFMPAPAIIAPAAPPEGTSAMGCCDEKCVREKLRVRRSWLACCFDDTLWLSGERSLMHRLPSSSPKWIAVILLVVGAAVLTTAAAAQDPYAPPGDGEAKPQPSPTPASTP